MQHQSLDQILGFLLLLPPWAEYEFYACEWNVSYMFLACLVDLVGLLYLRLRIGLTVGLAMRKAESRGRDVAVGFSG